MATAPRTKRSTRRVARAQKRTIQLAERKADKRARTVPLATLFAAREAAIRRGTYDILGRIIMLRFESGSMDFGLRNGPMLAQLHAGSAHAKDVAQPIVFLDGWSGLPNIVNLSPEACEACQRPCIYCDGTGERPCLGLRCGGYGKQIISYKSCSCCDDKGKPKPNCSECQGGGQAVDQTAECTTCKGTKVQPCPGCQGTKKISTGLAGGIANIKGGYFAPDGSTVEKDKVKTCPECEGSYHKILRQAQRWEDYYRGDLEEFVVMAPISTALFYADAMRDPDGKLEMIEFNLDKDGNIGALLVRQPAKCNGQPMYLLGGEANVRPMQ
jgi:hypothetical protein